MLPAAEWIIDQEKAEIENRELHRHVQLPVSCYRVEIKAFSGFAGLCAPSYSLKR